MNEQPPQEQEKEKENRKCEEHEESENCEKMIEEEKKLKVEEEGKEEEEERMEEEEAERCKVKLVSAPVAHTHGETIQASRPHLDRVKQETDPEVRCLSFRTGIS